MVSLETTSQTLSSDVTAIKNLLGPIPAIVPPDDTLQQKVTSLQTEVTQLKNSEVSLPSSDTETVSKLQEAFDTRCQEDDFKHRILCHAIDRLEAKLATHESKINDQATKMVSNNIKIGGLSEQIGEDTRVLTKTFFENIMELKPKDRDIIEASRMKGHLRKRIGDRMVDLPRLMYLWCSPQFRIKVEEISLF